MNPERLLNGYSLEITARDLDQVRASRDRLRPGMQVNLTFLPGDEVATLAATAAELHRLGLIPVPHISARRLRSAGQLAAFLQALTRDAGVDRVFIIAGDRPEPLGPFEDALAIIRSGMLGEAGIRQVGIAGYPEGHPKIDGGKLHQALRDKLEAFDQAGISVEIVTQFAFDSEPVLVWLEQLRAGGVTAPVRIGLPGPASAQSLLRFAARCGVGTSAKALTKYGVSLTRLLGTAAPDRLIADLGAGLDEARHGPVGVHLYPFGGIGKSVEWAAARLPPDRQAQEAMK